MKVSGIIANKLTTIVSKLGDNSDSLLPILAKDVTQDTATTLVYSKKGGEHDGKEKAIEEYGTGAIWIGGIPTLKRVFNKTVYKIAGINPDIDVRKLDLKNPDNIKYALDKVEKGSKEYLDLKKVADHPKLAKGLFISKFAFATLGTMALLGGLIKIKQKTTEKKIEKEIAKENAINYSIEEKMKKGAPSAFAPFKGMSVKNNEPSFKGIGAALSSFMYNPVQNMSILDLTISGTRLKDARKGERAEVLFKEASVVSFLYVLARPIQKGLEKISERFFHTPINLDIKTLVNPEFEEAVKDGSLKKGIKEMFNAASNGDKALLDFIWDSKNSDNAAIKLLKETGEIPTLKDKGLKLKVLKDNLIKAAKAVKNGDKKILESVKDVFKTGNAESLAKKGLIDPGAFMEPEVIKDALNKLDDFSKEIVKSPNLKKALNKTKALKTASIFANIGIAVLWLGILQPLLAIKARKVKNNGSNENPAITQVKKNLETKMSLK